MSPRAALFDVDGVILRGKGLNLFARHLVARGEATPALAARAAWYALGHRLGWFDGGAVLRRVAAAYLTGRPAEDLAAQGEAWFAAGGAAAIYPEARALVERHRRAGTPVALLSGGMDFLVAPVARALGAVRWAAVVPEMDAGILTGRLREPLCIDGGKLLHARAMVRELGVDLAECAFYTDDYGDVPLAQAVGEAIIVNPDPRLRREATRRGWPILDFPAPVERGTRWSGDADMGTDA
jgi:HAD superfamily hydrolase (TIGR01490 family)